MKGVEGEYLKELEVRTKAYDRVYIGWYFPKEMDFGSFVGEAIECNSVLKDPHARVDRIVQETAQKLAYGRDQRGFYWENKRQAKTALKKIEAAVKEDEAGCPMPGWAKKALDAGWKPPKGWKP